MHKVRIGVPVLLRRRANLPTLVRPLLLRLPQHLVELDGQVTALDRDIAAWHQSDDDSQRIAQVPGVGVLTATTFVAAIGEAKSFKNRRQLAAWLGLVPRQRSSGGKVRFQGISKRGDVY